MKVVDKNYMCVVEPDFYKFKEKEDFFAKQKERNDRKKREKGLK